MNVNQAESLDFIGIYNIAKWMIRGGASNRRFVGAMGDLGSGVNPNRELVQQCTRLFGDFLRRTNRGGPSMETAILESEFFQQHPNVRIMSYLEQINLKSEFDKHKFFEYLLCFGF